MSDNIFASKSKADLVQIVRVSKIMPIGQAQKMRKHELAAFLAEQMKNGGSEGETAESGGKDEIKKSSKSALKPSAAEPKTKSGKGAQQEDIKSEDKGPEEGRDEKPAPKKARRGRPRKNAKTDASENETKADDEASNKAAGKKGQKADGNDQAKSEQAAKETPAKTSPQSRTSADGNKKDKLSAEGDENPDPDETLEVDEFSARPRPSRRRVQGKAAERKRDQADRSREDKEQDRSDEGKERDKDRAKDKDKREYTPQKSSGVLELMPDGYGFLRNENYIQGPQDVYVSAQLIRRFNLRPGDFVKGSLRSKRDQDRYQALSFVEEVNGLPPEKMLHRPHFERLTPIYPTERYNLETDRRELSTRIIDLFSPIGKGQRGMIVSPPKAGKTILLQKIANAISKNNPEAHLIVLLIDERPEEVTDMQRRIDGEVVYSTFDKMPENHVKITELVLERAKRLVELGEDVVILLDSMTRMARAYNITITPTGRTLSGGLDPGALFHPKRFFGAARNIENGGSLTIVATSLIETGSRMDEVIFEEFKGTGNMEVYLDRKLSEKRIFPAIDVNRSGTRREELLLTPKQLEAVWGVRKAFGQLDTANVTELIINLLLKTKDNDHMIDSLNISLQDKAVIDSMRLPHDNSYNGNGKS